MTINKWKDKLFYVKSPASERQIQFAELLARKRGYFSFEDYLAKKKWKKQRYLTGFDASNAIGSLKKEIKND